MKLKTKLNYKSFFSTNHKDNCILYSSFFLLIYVSGILLFIYFNSLKYYAVSGNEVIGDSLENIERFLSEETIHLVNKDLVIANNHELIAKKLSNDTFAEEFYITVAKHSTADLSQNPGRISEIFVNLHPNSSYMSGYTFTEFDFISKADAKNMASCEANKIFPQVGIFDLIKINLNYISEKIGFGDLFSTIDIVTLETAKSEYIKTRVEEILLEQDNNFMETLQVNQQYRCAIRQNANRKGACLLANPEEKFKYYQSVEIFFEDIEKKSPSIKKALKNAPFFIDDFANSYQFESNLELLPLSEKTIKHEKSALMLEMEYNNKFRQLISDSIDYTNENSSEKSVGHVPTFLINDYINKQTLEIFDDILCELINPPEDPVLLENIRLNLTEICKTGALLNHPEIGIALLDHFYETKEIIVELPEQAGAFHGPELKNESNSTILAKD